MAKKGLGKGLEKMMKDEGECQRKIDTYKVYKDAVSRAYKDGIFSSDEKSILKELAKSLDLKAKERDLIIDEVKKENKGKVKKKDMTPEAKEIYSLTIEKEALEKEVKLFIKDEKELNKKIEELEEQVETLNSKNKKLEEENKEISESEQTYKEKVKELEEKIKKMRKNLSSMATAAPEKVPEIEDNTIDQELVQTDPQPEESSPKLQSPKWLDEAGKKKRDDSVAIGGNRPGTKALPAPDETAAEKTGARTKSVECPHCGADVIVELLPGRPTIFTCQDCGKKSYTE